MRACYDFFVGEFCDWYIEASKAALRDPKRAGQTAQVLSAVLDGSLRLLHPIVPFLTETLWWRLCELSGERGLPGRIMGCTSPRLIRAAWPQVGDFAQAAEHIWPKIQEIVTVLRNIRNEHKVDPRKPIAVSIHTASVEQAMRITAHTPEIELLATCKLKSVGPNVVAPHGAASARAAECEIFVESLVDEGAEKQRIAKRREELMSIITSRKARIANEGYVAKAPAHLVEQTRKEIAAAEAELQKLDQEG